MILSKAGDKLRNSLYAVKATSSLVASLQGGHDGWISLDLVDDAEPLVLGQVSKIVLVGFGWFGGCQGDGQDKGKNEDDVFHFEVGTGS